MRYKFLKVKTCLNVAIYATLATFFNLSLFSDSVTLCGLAYKYPFPPYSWASSRIGTYSYVTYRDSQPPYDWKFRYLGNSSIDKELQFSKYDNSLSIEQNINATILNNTRLINDYECNLSSYSIKTFDIKDERYKQLLNCYSNNAVVVGCDDNNINFKPDYNNKDFKFDKFGNIYAMLITSYLGNSRYINGSWSSDKNTFIPDDNNALNQFLESGVYPSSSSVGGEMITINKPDLSGNITTNKNSINLAIDTSEILSAIENNKPINYKEKLEHINTSIKNISSSGSGGDVIVNNSDVVSAINDLKNFNNPELNVPEFKTITRDNYLDDNPEDKAYLTQYEDWLKGKESIILDVLNSFFNGLVGKLPTSVGTNSKWFNQSFELPIFGTVKFELDVSNFAFISLFRSALLFALGVLFMGLFFKTLLWAVN